MLEAGGIQKCPLHGGLQVAMSTISGQTAAEACKSAKWDGWSGQQRSYQTCIFSKNQKEPKAKPKTNHQNHPSTQTEQAEATVLRAR